MFIMFKKGLQVGGSHCNGSVKFEFNNTKSLEVPFSKNDFERRWPIYC